MNSIETQTSESFITSYYFKEVEHVINHFNVLQSEQSDLRERMTYLSIDQFNSIKSTLSLNGSNKLNSLKNRQRKIKFDITCCRVKSAVITIAAWVFQKLAVERLNLNWRSRTSVTLLVTLVSGFFIDKLSTRIIKNQLMLKDLDLDISSLKSKMGKFEGAIEECLTSHRIKNAWKFALDNSSNSVQQDQVRSHPLVSLDEEEDDLAMAAGI